MQKSTSDKYPSVKTISDDQRIGMVKEIFSTITGKYDFLNHLLSLRRDIAWRRFAIDKMRFFRTNRFLDVACGTGDLSISACQKHRQIKVFDVDFVFPMVGTGKNKIEKKGLAGPPHADDGLGFAPQEGGRSITAHHFWERRAGGVP